MMFVWAHDAAHGSLFKDGRIAEVMAEITDAFERNLVDPFCINKKRIEQTLELGKDRCLLERVYKDSYHLPIDDVEKKMRWMDEFHKKQEKCALLSKHKA